MEMAQRLSKCTVSGFPKGGCPTVKHLSACTDSCVRRDPFSLPGRIFTNPTLIELRQAISQYDWLSSPRADDVVFCSRTEIITKQAIKYGLSISLGFRCLDFANFDLRYAPT
ncbi:hypothetical protein AVEN_214728-1 [Araneus ventricosus]|uniref:Uncharacterized protein n=1 Tax=Araneus ventricosus TaxID=182803 RepID=A0A4Y2KRS1_ARAVE|nr:hypothetical protein AVEN_214728-1 [Araneus ventricosus]